MGRRLRGCVFCAAALLLPFVGPFGAQPRSACWRGRSPTGRSSCSSACRARCSACSPAARWRWPARSSRRCCATRWPRRTRLASRRARRSARSSRSGWAGSRSPASPAIWVGGARRRGGRSGARRRRRASAAPSLVVQPAAVRARRQQRVLGAHHRHSTASPASTQSFSISRWLIGSLDSVDYAALAVFVVAVARLGGRRHAPGQAWNLMAVDPSWAATRGAHVTLADAERLRRGLGADGGHGGADRSDWIRRPRRAAPDSDTDRRRSPRAHAVRVPRRRHPAAPAATRSGRVVLAPVGSAGRRRDGHSRRTVPVWVVRRWCREMTQSSAPAADASAAMA